MSEQSPVTAPPADAPSPVQLRRELVDLVIGELRGPADGEYEVLPPGQRPRSRYLIGAVAPSGERYEPERDEDLGAGDADVEEADSGSDAGVASYLPSSIGMSFHVARETAELAITASWGRYERTRGEGGDALAWHRTPANGTVEIPLAVGVVVSRPVAEQPDVVVEAHIHDLGDRWAVTTFLRNNQSVPERSKDTAWLFQTQLAVHSPDGTPVFVAAERHVPNDAPSEERRLALAYRNRREFAVGHGIAVLAEVDSIDPTRARSIVTQALPMREVAQTGAPDDEPLLTALERDMRTLAVADDDALPEMLQPLIDGYGIWLERQDARVAAGVDGLAEYAETAAGVLADANVALGRMREGLETLRADHHACEAFRFANRVMADQRVHSLWAEHRRRGGEDPYETFDVPSNRSWRPFQLAFLLLGLPAIANPAHPDRSTDSSARGDLLWFPTGGGKTEAYLGLAAFTLAMRRLQGPLGDRRADAGVAVLMRYTLRVLTLQQFQRAAALICACEVARRERSDVWGDEPFRTGLWVGQATTPNTVDQAHDAIRNLHGDGYVRTGGGRPDQLASCPWCGSDIHAGRDIKVETYQAGRARVITYCSDKNGVCAFSRKGSPGEGIPVMTVDEEIYRRLPALLIATVDKFAQLPWNGSTQALFGIVDGRCERHGFRSAGIEDADRHQPKGTLPKAQTVDRGMLLRPPDLIIQDELHLISGPLGTLVGLYETAVDRLCSWELDGRTVRPKVIASTATVRQAREQMHALFLRKVAVFPPQGIDADDSFFAREQTSADDAGRLYLGVCAPGRRLKLSLIRTYLAFLAAGQTLFERYGRAADPWMSLVGYFGSIRELAGMRRACEDDIRSRLQQADDHGLAKRFIYPNTVEELTSRLSAADIPRLLEAMERPFGEDDPAAPRPLDVLLATNMISVGVDIRRLGLMVAAGQPKSTAEYIQATSRVGRSTPGVVCTVFNWARPRDLSHFTRFAHYHDSFYRHVEPLSVTPFAKRSLDRGLSALFAALVRLRDPASAVNGAAHLLDADDPYVKETVRAISDRAGAVTGTHEATEDVLTMLKERTDEWRSKADQLQTNGSRLGYKTVGDSTTIGLLTDPADGAWSKFTTLNSLRDVEASAGLVLRDGEFWVGTETGEPA